MTASPGRWFSCPRHYEGEVEKFFTDYLYGGDRRCLFIAAAGFDPRCLEMPRLFHAEREGRS